MVRFFFRPSIHPRAILYAPSLLLCLLVGLHKLPKMVRRYRMRPRHGLTGNSAGRIMLSPKIIAQALRRGSKLAG